MTMRPGLAVAKFDAVVDHWFEPLRGHPVADRVFEVASHMGDWSLVWVIITTAQALRSDHDLRRAPRIAGVILGESILVNRGIKQLFRRGEGDPNMRFIVVPIAAVVAASRVHTRMHHPSDVAAGVLIGLLIGKTVTAFWPMPHQRKVKRRHA